MAVSRESGFDCAVYTLDGNSASRRAVRTTEASHGGLPGRVETLNLAALLENQRVVPASALPDIERRMLFAGNDGMLAPLHVDGVLWGFALFASPCSEQRWNEERVTYLRTLASHLELALTSARGFERIADLARELSASNEFKDDLLAMLAHDFKGPLTVILGYCELLLENAKPGEREELETIYAQTKRLVRLSDDAVALAQTQAGGFVLDRVSLDLGEFVRESIRAHNRTKQRIQFEAPKEPVYASIDTARFHHVLDNLFMNALKYSDDQVSVALSRSPSTATVSVTDRGIGIPASELATVFTRFRRGSNARRKGISGSGVGLYVSRKIVEGHGGNIAVSSTEGHGSTFTITLPLDTQPSS